MMEGLLLYYLFSGIICFLTIVVYSFEPELDDYAYKTWSYAFLSFIIGWILIVPFFIVFCILPLKTKIRNFWLFNMRMKQLYVLLQKPINPKLKKPNGMK